MYFVFPYHSTLVSTQLLPSNRIYNLLSILIERIFLYYEGLFSWKLYIHMLESVQNLNMSYKIVT